MRALQNTPPAGKRTAVALAHAAQGLEGGMTKNERIERLETALREIITQSGPVPPDEWPACDEAAWQRARDLVGPHGLQLDLMVGAVTRFNMRFAVRIASAALEPPP
jgi:hypothetical protein